MASFWDAVFRNSRPPGAPGGPPRQLSVPRLMNLMVNPFAINMTDIGPANLQRNVYRYATYGLPAELQSRFKFQNPFPIWIGCDITLGPQKVARGHFPIPANFFLLNYFASSSSNVRGGFKLVVYDTNRRIPLTVRPVNFNTLAGQGSAPMYLQEPYAVNPEGGEVKIKWTITGLETVQTTVQFGLYGIQVENTDQPAPTVWQRAEASINP